MGPSVADYDIIKFLTNDKVLCQNWRAFATALGLESDIDMLERKYFQYCPVEEVSLIMMEKWEDVSHAKIEDLIGILKKMENHEKCIDQIQKYVSKVQKSGEMRKKPVVKEVKEIKIPSKATSFSYERIFGEYLDPSVTFVVIQDPNFQSSSQLNNLDLFLSLLLKKCPNLEKIHLLTSFDERKDKGHIRKLQMETLTGFTRKLKDSTKTGINLVVTYDQTLYLQERRIVLDNGWTFALEKGLDIYYYVESSSEHWTNLDIRKVKETTITALRS